MTKIAARDAVIEWNETPNGLPSDDVSVRRLGESQIAVEIYDCSAGADTAGWCESGDPRDTPAGLFASKMFNAPSPLPRPVIRAWLEQLSKIAECHWARVMLAEMVAHDDQVNRSGGDGAAA